MNSTKRKFAVSLLLFAIGVAIWIFLKHCGPEETGLTSSLSPMPQAPSEKIIAPKPSNVKPEETHNTPQNNTPPAKEEIDLAPPVQLTASEQLPNVAKCVTRNFPPAARPHVKLAVVTVRLIVDKFGNVRSDTPIDVEFPQEVEEDVVPAMRKLFIQAGSHAFGAKKCPPHVVNGQNVGYAIEVPLKYTP